MSEHTELPWKHCSVTGGWDGIESNDGQLVAKLALNNPANAEYIVLACNSHKDLLDACKAQYEAIDRLFAMLIDAKGMKSPFFPSKCGQPWEALCQGNAAIEQAKPK